MMKMFVCWVYETPNILLNVVNYSRFAFQFMRQLSCALYLHFTLVLTLKNHKFPSSSIPLYLFNLFCFSPTLIQIRIISMHFSFSIIQNNPILYIINSNCAKWTMNNFFKKMKNFSLKLLTHKIFKSMMKPMANWILFVKIWSTWLKAYKKTLSSIWESCLF